MFARGGTQVRSRSPPNVAHEQRLVAVNAAGALSRLLAAPQALELLARRGVEAVADAAAGALLLVIDVLHGLETREERTRVELAHLPPRCPPPGGIRPHHAHEPRLP